MKVFEQASQYSLLDEDKPEKKLVYLYDQPAWRRMIYLLAEQADKLTYKNPVGKFLSRYVDKAGVYLHERRCNGECVTMYRRLPSDPPGTFEMTPDRSFLACGYMPPTNQVDMKLYDLSIRGRTLIAKYEESIK